MATSARKLLSAGIVLHNGDAMTQEEFHDAYESMPEDYRAELIGGIVFEPSPLGLEHGYADSRFAYLLEHYAARTIGVRCALNASVIMSDEDEVQPDVLLRIEPEYGGQSRNKNAKTINAHYLKGTPELAAEIAHSSRAIDLHLKKERYLLAGVGEYVVVCLEPAKVYWFDRSGKEVRPDRKGIFKSKILPGLWIDFKALFDLDYDSSMAALNQGMQTKEYVDFVERLAKAKSRSTRY